MTDFDNALSNFVAAYDTVVEASNAKSNFKHYGKTRVEAGSKFVRVVRTNGNNTGGGVACFVEKATGDILKAEGWKKPSKLRRGYNIFKPETYLGKMDPYGSWLYLR